MKKIILGICIVLGLASAIALVKKRKAAVEDAPMTTKALLKVQTVVPKLRSVSENASFLAKVEAVTTADIASVFSARIRAIDVRENDLVDKGDILARIDDTEIKTLIDAIKMQIKTAQKQYAYSAIQHKRNHSLYEVGGLAKEKLEVSDMVLSNAKTVLNDLNQKKKSLDNKLEYFFLKAPFDGVVGTIYLREGSLAMPGKTILVFYSHDQKMTFRFAGDVIHIKKGHEVWQDGAKVSVVSNIYKDTQNGLVVGEVFLGPSGMPNGSFRTISIVHTKAFGTSVPVKSLLHRSHGVSVMIYKGGSFVEKEVSIIAQDNEYAIIEPSIQLPVACAAEAKLSRLPAYGNIKVLSGTSNE